jgi:phospholipid/cholesterol/gamma-HCH transport system substrate-binding protein
LGRLQRPTGTFGLLLDDPTLYLRLSSVTAQMDTVLRQMHSQQGTLGRLLYNDTLYVRMLGAAARADSLLALLTNSDGFAARMLNDQEMYDRLNKSLTDLNEILRDVRQNPRKYTKGMVKLF